MHLKRTGSVLLCVFALLLPAAGTQASEKLDSARGEAVLQSMSVKLAAARSFSFSTTEVRDELDRSGKPVHVEATRDTLVRRPNGFWSKFAGDRDWEIWYDGKLLTVASAVKKIYIQAGMPPTLDETMDLLAARYRLDLPMSDVLYSSPREAFLDAQTRGGFAGKEVIDGKNCARLSYTSPAVDWQLWVDEKSSLPCLLKMTYKKESAKTSYRIAFNNWNLSPETAADAFAFRVPEDYVRIPILERAGGQQPQSRPSDRP